MQNSNMIRAGLLALLISFLAAISWEFYLRHNGVTISFDDNDALWSNKRAMVYEPRDQATVFIGSSRIKFDLDIPTWEVMTGKHAIQLANVGSDPKPYLEDLANDKNFKGNLVIDVTEGLFFSEYNSDDYLKNNRINYYKKITPTQRFSFLVNKALESQFVFLDQDYLSISAMLNHIKLSKRPGVFSDPLFPLDFDRTSFARQSLMDDRFLADTSIQNQVKKIWLFFASVDTAAPISGRKLDTMFNLVKTDVEKIKARGGQVLFVRTPSSGPYRQAEIHGYPRKDYWDRLLAATGCPGIYFEDYPVIGQLECPEWSHLTPSDAIIYTKNLIRILQQKKGGI